MDHQEQCSFLFHLANDVLAVQLRQLQLLAVVCRVSLHLQVRILRPAMRQDSVRDTAEATEMQGN